MFRRLKQPAFLEASNPPVAETRKQPIQLPRDTEPAPASPPASPPTTAGPPEQEPEQEEEELYDDATAQRPQEQEPPARSLLNQGLPRRPPSDDEEEEEYQNWEGRLSILLQYCSHRFSYCYNGSCPCCILLYCIWICCWYYHKSLNILYKDHVPNVALYGSLPPISLTLCYRRLQFARHCCRWVDEPVHSILFFIGTIYNFLARWSCSHELPVHQNPAALLQSTLSQWLVAAPLHRVMIGVSSMLGSTSTPPLRHRTKKKTIADTTTAAKLLSVIVICMLGWTWVQSPSIHKKFVPVWEVLHDDLPCDLIKF